MVGKNRSTQKRKSLDNDQDSTKKKMKLTDASAVEEDVTADVPQTSAKGKMKQKQQRKTTDLDTATTSTATTSTATTSQSNQGKSGSDSVKTVAKMNLRKRPLASARKRSFDTATDSKTNQVKSVSNSMKTAAKKKLKKKPLPFERKKGFDTETDSQTKRVKSESNSEKAVAEKKPKMKPLASGRKKGTDTATDLQTDQVNSESDSVKTVAKKKLKKKPLSFGRNKGLGPYSSQKQKKIELKRGAKLNEDCHKAKKLWEKGRRLDCAIEEQTYLTAEVHLCVAGKIPQIIFSHDMARVMQWLIKHSNVQRVGEIAEECAPVIIRMSQSKYAKYCVQALMRQRNEQVKKLVIDKLFGNIVTLATHPVAASVVGEAYDRCANNLLRQHMKQEMYSSLFTKQKIDKIKDLKGMFQMYPELKDSTLTGMNNILTKVFDRKLQKSSLIHDVLLDFFEVCPDKMGTELSPLVLQSGTDFVTTKNGVMALLKSFSLATEEERKKFLEGLQEHVPKLACSEPGHFLLIALLTYMDDISLMKETVLNGLIEQLPEIASHVHGSKVLLHIISTEKIPFLPPKLTRMLELDLDRVKVCQKKKALLEIMLTPLLQSVSSKPEIWLADGPVSVATFNILKTGKGPELAAAFEALAKHVTTSKTVIKHYGKDYTVVEHPGIHKILRKMIDYEPLPSQEVKGSFASALKQELTDATIKDWLNSSRGCFMLSFLLKQTANSKLKKRIESELNDKAVMTKVKAFSGGEVLLEQLKS